LKEKWRNFFIQYISLLGKYVEIQVKEANGCLLLLFAKSSIKDRISQITSDSINFGIIKNLSNNGAAIIRLNIDDSNLVFIDAELEKGIENWVSNIH